MKYEDGNMYHIYNRGANKSKIFWCKRHYECCIDLLIKNANKLGITLVAYCLMPNHYHLLLQQEEGTSISKFLKNTFIAYTLFLNIRENHSGTLFQGRAKSKQIDSEDYMAVVIQYIHINPVLAGLVKYPEEWNYSDYKEWILTDSQLKQDPAQKSKYEFREKCFSSGLEYKDIITKNINDRVQWQCIELE